MFTCCLQGLYLCFIVCHCPCSNLFHSQYCVYVMFPTAMSTPVNLNALAEKVKAGENAATVLGTELPVFKATPGNAIPYY